MTPVTLDLADLFKSAKFFFRGGAGGIGIGVVLRLMVTLKQRQRTEAEAEAGRMRLATVIAWRNDVAFNHFCLGFAVFTWRGSVPDLPIWDLR